MRKTDLMSELPEVTRYTKYYEHDGMLRAYSNRAMLLAMIFGVLAMASLGFAMYVRIQPPTVIRVDKDGNQGRQLCRMLAFALLAHSSRGRRGRRREPLTRPDERGGTDVKRKLSRFSVTTRCISGAK